MKSLARFLLFILFVLVVLSGFIFTVNNTAEVALWLGVSLDSRPVALWVLLAFGTGGLLGLLLGFGLWRRMQSRLQIMQMSMKLQQAEKELSALKQQVKSSPPRRP